CHHFITPPPLFSLPLCFVFCAGSSLSDQVRQTPAYIQANSGDSATISCSHSIQSYDVILWYKRSEDTQLQLLGYRYLGTSFPEPGVDVDMEGGQTCTLTIERVNQSSTGVYFCAASRHSAVCHCFSVQKPPSNRFLSSDASNLPIVAPALSPLNYIISPILRRVNVTTDLKCSLRRVAQVSGSEHHRDGCSL
uniref:Ig-like domain-containing protein n=1 Tax=Fundulus heteroclitus TaxID=8078 RepID=A0A3Q2QI92_FUNHE